MSELNKMKNIGKVIDGLLVQVSIDTPDKLIHLGAKQAFIKIRSIDNTACIRMLYSLQGAIDDVSDTMLDTSVKKDLLDFYKSLE